MERTVCIHGHFYQPPRENPWLEAIEVQDSAYPYHDWNERINAESYAPNGASRILDGDKRIVDIVSNYRRISFNFGPTLLSWMETCAPKTYAAILDADRKSAAERFGHGNAMAQAYNHVIMPLATTRDKRTQITWGIRDFEHRFGRFPEGMWLPETAVDLETVELLASLGIKFTILAPHQARRVRKTGTGRWKDVSGGRIDPSRAYVIRFYSGLRMNIFFYDGPISQAVAFENLLGSGEQFAHRLLTGFSDRRSWPQILHIATDGETYGHHYKFGEMALTFALEYLEKNGLARVTNYGEYLERHPPTHEVQIFENTSWSCFHGIERWRSDCGCNSGGRPGWNQQWRKPLREALDWLRERLAGIFEEKAGRYLKDPWRARDGYIDVMLDRSEPSVEAFMAEFGAKVLAGREKREVLKLMEMQRHMMLMYTSCGWFFDELSGLETVQVLQYAARAIQIAGGLHDADIEEEFVRRLRPAKSNIPDYGDGAAVYERFVKPAMVDLKKVAAHYAVSSVIEEYPDKTDIFSYVVTKKDSETLVAGSKRLVTGRIGVTSRMNGEAEDLSYCALHLGEHLFYGGIRSYLGDRLYGVMKQEMLAAFEHGDFAGIIRLMDTHFGMHNYSLKDLFRDRQREILRIVLRETVERYEAIYQDLYNKDHILVMILRDSGLPVPGAITMGLEYALLSKMKQEFKKEAIDLKGIATVVKDMKKWGLAPASAEVEFVVRRRLEQLMRQFHEKRRDVKALSAMVEIIRQLRSISMDLDYWTIQNLYFEVAGESFGEFLSRAEAGERNAGAWIRAFRQLGEVLNFNVPVIFGDDRTGGS